MHVHDLPSHHHHHASHRNSEHNLRELKGTIDRKGDALSPDFGKCSNCTMEADIRINSPGARVSLLAWYEDKKNLVEVRLMEDKDKVLVKQRSGGFTVAKQKALLPIDTGVDYNVRTYFDGYDVQVYIDDVLLVLISTNALPNGNVGFRVKSVQDYQRLLRSNKYWCIRKRLA
jgi:hypothetical protein